MQTFVILQKLKKKEEKPAVGTVSLDSKMVTLQSYNTTLRKMFAAGIPTVNDQCIYNSVKDLREQIEDVVDRPFYLRKIPKTQYNNLSRHWSDFSINFNILLKDIAK